MTLFCPAHCNALSSVSPAFLRGLGWRLDSSASPWQALGALELHNVSQRLSDPRNWTPSYNGQMDIGDWTSGQTRDICKSGQNLETDMCTLVSGLVKALIVVSLCPCIHDSIRCCLLILLKFLLTMIVIMASLLSLTSRRHVTWQLWPIWGRGGNHEYKQSPRSHDDSPEPGHDGICQPGPRLSQCNIPLSEIMLSSPCPWWRCRDHAADKISSECFQFQSVGDTVTPPGAGRWQADRPINSPALRISGLWPPTQSPFSNITGPRVFMTITGSAWWNLSPSLKYCSHWPNTTRYHKYPHPSLSPLTPHTSSWGEFLTGHWQPYLGRPPWGCSLTGPAIWDPSHAKYVVTPAPAFRPLTQIAALGSGI